MSSNDPFGNTAGRQLAKATQQNYLLAWRHFLGLLATVEPMALDAPPSERLTIERVRALVHHLAETNTPRSVAAQIGRLYEVARLMMPDLDWSWLKFVKARLRTAAPALLRKGPVITSVQLLGVGQQLMDESHPSLSNPISLADAVRYRDGLMIALLAFVPLRRKNIAAIEIGRHLVQEGDRWFIIIPRGETKTGTSIEFAVPELLVPYFTTYLSIVRPRILQGPSCKALWINREGGALSPGAVSAVVIRRRPGGSVFASLPMMSAMLQQQRGLSPRLVRLASPATSFRTAICAPPQGTTIVQEGSRPVEPMHSSSRKGADGKDQLLIIDDKRSLARSHTATAVRTPAGIMKGAPSTCVCPRVGSYRAARSRLGEASAGD